MADAKKPYTPEEVEEAMRVVERRLRGQLAQALRIDPTLITVLLTPAGNEKAKLVIMIDGKPAPAEVKALAVSLLARPPADEKPN